MKTPKTEKATKTTDRITGEAVVAAKVARELESKRSTAHACWCNDPQSVAEEVAINNRPQDGRVCDCEDAPCCGHYEP